VEKLGDDQVRDLVVDAVEECLGESGVKSAKLSLGDRSYTLVAPAPITGAL
jgi:hypothetical protein